MIYDPVYIIFNVIYDCLCTSFNEGNNEFVQPLFTTLAATCFICDKILISTCKEMEDVSQILYKNTLKGFNVLLYQKKYCNVLYLGNVTVITRLI